MAQQVTAVTASVMAAVRDEGDAAVRDLTDGGSTTTAAAAR
jgi:hypothetical protein